MLELGGKEKEFHFEIGRIIDPQKINFVFTFGNLGTQIAEGARTIFPIERVFSFHRETTADRRVKEIYKCKDAYYGKSL